jgi:hypothetical protein
MFYSNFIRRETGPVDVESVKKREHFPPRNVPSEMYSFDLSENFYKARIDNAV